MKTLKILLIAILLCCSKFSYAQWTSLNSGTTETLNAVCFTDKNTGYAGGVGATNATLLKTTDGGMTWSNLSINTINEINSISFGTSNTGYIFTENSELFKTSDAGANWNQIKTFGAYGGKIKFINRDTGFVAEGNQKIYRTTDGGVTWDSTKLSNFYNSTAIHFPSKQVGYISSFGGKIAKTTDMGSSWNIISQPTSKQIRDVHFVSEKVGFAVGGDGVSSLILKTNDGGKSWNVQTTTPSTTSAHNAVFFTRSDTGYLGNTTIYLTKDAGAAWNSMTTPEQIKDIYFPSSSIGYAVGYNGAILKLNSNSTNCANDLMISPQNNQLQTGGKATFNANTSDPNPSFIWQSDFGQGFQTLKNFGNYKGANTNTLSISNVQLSNHNQKIRAISTSGNCVDTSNTSTIIISDTCINKVNDTILMSVTDTLIINANITELTPPNNVNKLKVYPNPASTHITIDYGNFTSMSGYTLTILNSNGQRVFTTPVNQQTSFINLSTWTGNGIYYLQLKDAQNNTIENRKIIIQ